MFVVYDQVGKFIFSKCPVCARYFRSKKKIEKTWRLYGFCQLAIKWMESYLSERKQFVQISGKRSREQEIDIGTPQGSRLSPLLFIILMADLDLWTGNSTLSNFADDTQSIIVRDNRKNLLETASSSFSSNFLLRLLAIIMNHYVK